MTCPIPETSVHSREGARYGFLVSWPLSENQKDKSERRISRVGSCAVVLVVLLCSNVPEVQENLHSFLFI